MTRVTVNTVRRELERVREQVKEHRLNELRPEMVLHPTNGRPRFLLDGKPFTAKDEKSGKPFIHIRFRGTKAKGSEK